MTPPLLMSTEQMLEHARSLRKLARGLLLDDGSAEDVVQEAWVLALERPPAHQERIGGWLHTVVRTLALKRLRGERRRNRREEIVAKPDRTSSTLHSIESAALCKRLVDAVCELDEPMRSVISMRYFDGLPPREIARRLGIPKNTVRARLQRGLAKLRIRLDQDSDGARATWAQALVAFAGVKGGSLSAPHTSTLIGSPSVNGFIGVVAMTAVGKWSVAGIVFGLVGLGFMSQSNSEREALAKTELRMENSAKQAASLSDPRDQIAAALREGQAVVEPVDSGALSVVAPPAWAVADRYPFRVLGNIVDPWGRPIHGAIISVAVRGHCFNQGQSASAEGDFQLSFHASSPSVDAHIYVHNHSLMSGMRTLKLQTGVEHSIHMDLSSLTGIPGGMRNFKAKAFVGPLHNSPGLLGDSQAPVRFQSDSGVQLSLPEDMVVFDHSEGSFAFSSDTPVNMSSFSGLVQRPDGTPAKGALVWITLDGVGSGICTTTNTEGAWAINNQTPGTYTFKAGGDDFGLQSGQLIGTAGSHTTHNVLLDRGNEIRGRILGPNQSPLPFLVHAEAVDSNVTWSDTTLADSQGRFAFPNVMASAAQLTIFDPNLGQSDATQWGIPLHVVDSMLPDGKQHDVQLSRSALDTSSISLALLDASGETVRNAEVRLLHAASQRGVFLTPVTGEDATLTYIVHGLPAGTYQLEAVSRKHGWIDLGTVLLQPGTKLDQGSYSFPAPGSLVATCLPSNTALANHWQIVHISRTVDSFAWEGWPLDAWDWVEEEAPDWTKIQLPPGTYALSAGAPKTGRAWIPFKIESNLETEFVLPLDLLTDAKLMLGESLQTNAHSKAKIRITDSASGLPVWTQKEQLEGGQVTIKLLPGAYRATLLSDPEIVSEVAFEVEAGLPASVMLEAAK
ncbi:MAG: RNA polymerase sigma factor (sigma-70 family) [Planctomycetota bacterium]|jgi:RNA polymerase sigma factor (sigma-70 family)